MPAHAPRAATPATTPRRTSRAIRAAGQRKIPRRPRSHTANRSVPWTRRRTQGRSARQLHGELAAQHDDRADVLERRREPQLTDERRASLGRLDRHVADEMQARAPARPAPARSRRRPSGSNSSGQSATLPKTAPAWRPDASAPTIAARDQHHGQQRALPRPELHARRDQCSAVAERDSRQPEQRAAGRPRRHRSGEPVRGEHAADRADDRAHEEQEPELANGWPSHGRRPVDRREQHVPHVGSLERERSTPAARSQARPRRRRRRRPPSQSAPSVRTLRDLCGRELAVADETGADEDRDATEDRGQVRLVQRIDPVDVRQPLAAPDAPPLEQRAFEVSVRIGGGNAVQRYSWTSSMSVPKAAFGCTNATVVPRDPGRGCWSMTCPPWSLTACNASAQSRTR